ncbi:MAG: radical SAM protein [Candidatus Pacearchaeota archaeon]
MANPFFIRNLKNKLLGDYKILKIVIKVINAPIIGDIYDRIYFRLIRKKINNSDILVTIEPNNLCNLNCIMCPYKRMKRKKETMSMELFKKIVDESKKIGVKEIHLTQYNEPFTDKNIFEKLDYIRKSGLKSSFYSNGTLLNEEIIEKILKSPPDLIRFSVDGVKKETFESIRRGANFEEVISGIEKLYKRRNEMGEKFPIIEVFFTLLKENKDESKKFLEYWKDKCDFASIYPADSRDSGKFVGVDYKKFKPYPCFNPKRVIILSNGKVVLCCVDIDGDVVLGDLKKQGLREILNSDKYKKIHLSQMNRSCQIPMCKDCSKFYIDSAFQWWVY